MQFSSYISLANKPLDIAEDFALMAKSGPNDLGFLFITLRSRAEIISIAHRLKKDLSIGTLLVCTSAGVIGQEKEIEDVPGASLFLAQLPGVKIQPFFLDQQHLVSLNAPHAWNKFLGISPADNPVFVVFPDPFLVDVTSFIVSLNKFYPGCPIVGGLASGAAAPHANVLMINNQDYDQGMVGLVLTGNLRVETVVSQGCRPIGETYIVTKAERNVIHELAGKPFIEIVKNIYEASPQKDRNLMQDSLFVGIAMNEYKHSFHRGDFLIRGVMSIDPANGSGVIGDVVHKGQTIQLHVRDAAAATEDLTELLNAFIARKKESAPKGAMLFSCNGRGQNLFKVPNHDISLLQKKIGPLPTAGFFCAGEIGPVGGKNFIHGFTDSIALFYPK